jgi:hypothetical protein
MKASGLDGTPIYCFADERAGDSMWVARRWPVGDTQQPLGSSVDISMVRAESSRIFSTRPRAMSQSITSAALGLTQNQFRPTARNIAADHSPAENKIVQPEEKGHSSGLARRGEANAAVF